MATRFGVWIDTPNTGESGNVMSYSAFASDTQRASGFIAGTIASSVRMNTALRQATLVTAALMSSLDDSSTLDMNSSLADLTSFFTTQFGSFGKKGSSAASARENANVVWGANGELEAGPKIFVSTSEPTGHDGTVGDIWLVIEA